MNQNKQIYEVKNGKILMNSTAGPYCPERVGLLLIKDNLGNTTLLKHGEFYIVEQHYNVSRSLIDEKSQSDLLLLNARYLSENLDEQVKLIMYLIDHTLSSLSTRLFDSIYNQDETEIKKVISLMLN